MLRVAGPSGAQVKHRLLGPVVVSPDLASRAQPPPTVIRPGRLPWDETSETRRRHRIARIQCTDRGGAQQPAWQAHPTLEANPV